MDKVCVSVGALYRVVPDKNEAVCYLGKLPISGIELLFRDYQQLKSFSLNEEALRIFEKLKFKSMHAPWHGIIYDSGDIGQGALGLLLRLYEKFDARNIVFHANNVPDYNRITAMGLPASTENDDWRNAPGNYSTHVASLLERNPELSLTLDIAHALTVSQQEPLKYIDLFKKRITQVHLSSTPVVPDHSFLHKHDCPELRALLKKVKALEVPVVIESVVPDSNSLELLTKEIKYLTEI